MVQLADGNRSASQKPVTNFQRLLPRKFLSSTHPRKGKNLAVVHGSREFMHEAVQSASATDPFIQAIGIRQPLSPP